MALRSFWAIELVPGKEYTTTPDFDLHLTSAVLPASAKDKERTVVTVLTPEEEEGAPPSTPFAIASLKIDVADSQHLDLLFDADMPITFTAVGKNPVHLTGYLVPDGDNGGMGYDSDEFDEVDEDDEISEEDDGEEVDEQEIRNQINKRKALALATQQNGGPAKKAKQEQPQQPQKQKQPQQPQGGKPQTAEGGKPQTPKQNEGKKAQNQQKSPAQQQKGGEPKVQQLQGGLQIFTVAEGAGKVATKGAKVFVKYVGRLTKGGKIFDQSTKKPFSFNLGKREVITGWDLGIIGMKEGEKRKLVIPAELAYGASGAAPTIPANASLTFDVELVAIK